MVYSGDPATSPIDAVRFWLGDTGDPSLLTDPEIQYVIDTNPAAGGDPILLAASLCGTLIAKYSGWVSISADGVSYSGDQLANKYNALATQLRAEHAQRMVSTGAPVLAADDFPYTIPRNFRMGMYDNLQAGVQGPLPINRLEWPEEEDPANYNPTP